MPKAQKTQSGNVLFLILIVTALFGALSFAVSEGMRGSGQDISEEKTRLLVTEILEYGATMRQAVQALRISGCEDVEISFQNNIIAGYTNASAPSDNTCHVFHPDGGGINYVKPEADVLDKSQLSATLYGEWYVSGNSNVDTTGTNSTELILYLPWVTQSVCNKINENLNITTLTDAEDNSLNLNQKFTGSYAVSSFTIADNNDQLDGKMAGCTEDNSNVLMFFQVLLSR